MEREGPQSGLTIVIFHLQRKNGFHECLCGQKARKGFKKKQQGGGGGTTYLDINIFSGWVLQEESEGVIPDRGDCIIDNLAG